MSHVKSFRIGERGSEVEYHQGFSTLSGSRTRIFANAAAAWNELRELEEEWRRTKQAVVRADAEDEASWLRRVSARFQHSITKSGRTMSPMAALTPLLDGFEVWRDHASVEQLDGLYDRTTGELVRVFKRDELRLFLTRRLGIVDLLQL